MELFFSKLFTVCLGNRENVLNFLYFCYLKQTKQKLLGKIVVVCERAVQILKTEKGNSFKSIFSLEKRNIRFNKCFL